LLFTAIYSVALNATEASLRKRLFTFLAGSFTLYSLLGIFTFLTTHAVRLRHIQNSMTSGGLTMIGVLLCVTLLLAESSRRKKLLYLAAALLNAWALLATSTRSAWLGCLIGLVLLFWLMRKKALWLLPLLMAGFYFFTPAGIAYHINHFFDPHWGTNIERLAMWRSGFEIWRDYPICGIGDVSTQSVFEQYLPPGFTYLIGHFHNNWVHIAVTLGTVGLLAFGYLMGFLLHHLLKRIRQTSLGSDHMIRIAVLAAFIAFHTCGLFEWNFGDAEIITTMWFLIGLTMD
jgi:O-antigen ligase